MESSLERLGEVTRTIAITAYGHIDSREFPVDHPFRPLFRRLKYDPALHTCALIKHSRARLKQNTRH